MDHIFHYQTTGGECLKRGRSLITRFDDGEPACLFYAALELRLGIESRLLYYIESALRVAELPKEKIKGYSPSKLMPELAKIDPEAMEPATWIIASNKNGDSLALEYTPITPLLARYHGMLGELLHSTFIRKNPQWYLKRRSASPNQKQTMYDYRDFLLEVADELEKACRGALSTPPKIFLEQLDSFNKAIDEDYT
jgi:hypothetical protein